MGGAHSTTSISDVSNTVANTSILSSNTCIGSSDNENLVDVNGDGNIVTGVNQFINSTYTQNCLQTSSNIAAYNNTSANQAVINQSTKQQAGLGFLDCSNTKASDNVQNNITNNTQINNVSTCLNAIQTTNVTMVNGIGNVLSGVDQTALSTNVVQCLNNSTNAVGATSNATNASNLGQQYQSESWLEPFTSALTAIMGMGILAVVLIIIFIVVVVIVYKYMTKKSSSSSSSSSSSTSSTSAMGVSHA